MQILCNQYVTRKISWSVGRVARVMINASALILGWAWPPPNLPLNYTTIIADDCG
jgi:hypothetical protein